MELVISETEQPRTYAWLLWRVNTRGAGIDHARANDALRQRYECRGRKPPCNSEEYNRRDARPMANQAEAQERS